MEDYPEENPSSTAFVYGLRCTCHPEAGIRYVGATTRTPEERLREHLKPSIRQPAISNWVSKHDRNIESTIIETCSREDIETREMYWISVYRELVPNLLNIAEGGMRPTPYSPTPEQRSRISESLKKYYQNNPNPFKGKTHSAETRQKMVDARVGYVMSEETRRKVGDASRGRVVSQNTRDKLSALNSGENNPQYGKPGYWTGKKRDAKTVEALRKANTGENNAGAKLTDEKVRELRRRVTLGESYKALALEFQVSPVTLYQAAVRKTWKHVE